MRVRLEVLVAAVLLAVSSSGPAWAVSDVLNRKTVPTTEINGAKYIALDVFQDALGLEGDQTLTGSYRLFGSPGLTKDVVVEFSADSPQVLINDKESAIGNAPVMKDGKMQVPYDEFVAMFVTAKEAEKAEAAPQPSSGSVLTEVIHSHHGSITTLGFKWSARPDYRFLFDGDTATLQVVFKNSSKKLTAEEVAVESEEVSRVTFEPIPEKGVLVASVHLKNEVTYDSTFDEASGTLTLRLKGPGTLEAPPTSVTEVGGTDMQSFLARNMIVLDAGHGGEDKGVAPDANKAEARVALELALRLKPLLEKGGFRVALTRNSDGGLALPDRLVAINAQKPGMVVSLHANASPNPDLQGTQIYVLKAPATLDPSDPFASRKGTWGPSADEVNLAGAAAKRISGVIGKTLKRRVEVIPESLLMPASKVFAPAMTIEVGYLTSPRDRALFEKKTFTDKLAYSIYAGLYDHFLEQWKAAGGRGPAVAKLQDVPADLPPAERVAPAPVATKPELKKAPSVVVPESADAADPATDEEPMDGPDEDPPTSKRAGTLPKAAALPPPAPRPAAPAKSAAPVEEDDDDTGHGATNTAVAVTPSAAAPSTKASPKANEEDEE